MVHISKLYHLPHIPIEGDENSCQRAKIWVLSILGGHYVKSMHDKASLITFLCTQGGLLLQVIHKLSVNQPVC